MSAPQPENFPEPKQPKPEPRTPTHLSRPTTTQTQPLATFNIMGPDAYFRSLPDTEANRRLLSRWTEQDARSQRVQQTLFSQVHEQVQPSVTEPKTYQFETTTIKLHAEDETNAPLLGAAALDRLIVSRMNSGSSSTHISTSETIFLTTISAVNIEKEFPTVFAYKKNQNASVLGFVSYLKEKEHFVWPSNEDGSALRECLNRMASELMAAISIPPKLIAVMEIVALYLTPKLKSNLLSDFHASLSYSDADFPEFQELCSQGGSDDSVLRFKPAALQPGFDRLVGNESIDAWIDTAAVLIDSACFQDIGKLEHECHAALDKWKRFSIAAQPPKTARVDELQLYVVLTAACERAAIPPISDVDRAQALLRSITLTIKLQGKPVSVRELIRDRIAENRFGKGAVSRHLVFELYEHFYMSSGHHGCESQSQGTQAAKLATPAQQTPTVLTLDAASTSMIPVSITCRDCQVGFEEVPGEWAAKFPGAHMPKSCRACIAARKKKIADAVMLVEADTVMITMNDRMGGVYFDTDDDMSDSDDYEN
jgi:hypothetical protein